MLTILWIADLVAAFLGAIAIAAAEMHPQADRGAFESIADRCASMNPCIRQHMSFGFTCQTVSIWSRPTTASSRAGCAHSLHIRRIS